MQNLQQYNWLRRFPELEQITDPVWLDAAGSAEFMRVPAGSTVFSPGDPCAGLLFLVEGRVRVFMAAENGREILLAHLCSGDLCVFTLTTLLQAAYYSAQAVTETECLAVRLPSASFRDAFDNSPEFRNFTLSRLASRMHETLVLLHQVAFNRLEIRLACLLTRHTGENPDGAITMTHQQIAQELGTTREVVSRMLKEMERSGCLRLARKRIELVDQAELEHLSARNRPEH